jgi:hypothetical protein
LKKYIFFASILALFFSACSTKEVFKPSVVGDDWSKYGTLDESIIDTSLNVALLEDRKVLTNDGVMDVSVSEKDRVISYSDNWIISASLDGNTTLTYANDKSLKENFALKKTVASASVKGDTLAVLFADNELALYSISTKELFFKEQGSQSLAVNTKIVNPHFLNDLVIFSTLDGKVVIVNSKLKKKLRTVIVSAEDNFNNVIYFNMVDNKIIAATGYKILSMSDKELRAKYEIRSIVYDGENIFIATKQGEVVSLTPNLEVNAKIKFPFAHFLGMISDGDKLYILEREGYMIVLNKNMVDFTVREADVENGFIFVGDKEFYIEDEKILIK